MAGSRVYFGGLSYDCKESDLENFVSAYGRIKDVVVKDSYGFVEFEDYRDADDAVLELNGTELLGERVTVEHARGRGGNRRGGGGGGAGRGGGRQDGGMSSNRLHVENVPGTVSWQDLKDHMRQAGDVLYADVHKVRRGEGVVEFSSHGDMMNALDTLDNSELGGRRIRLSEERRRFRR